MKKVINLILILYVCFFGINVFADCNKYGCAKCVYNDGRSFKFTYDLQSSGNGTADLKFSYEIINNTSNGHVTYKATQSLVARNFIKDNKLFCPENIYYKYSAGGNTVVAQILNAKEKNSLTAKLESNTNNNLSIVEATNSVGKSCTYDLAKITGNGTVKATVTVADDKLVYDFADGYKINPNSDVVVDDFKGEECPKLYGQCGSSGENKYCQISKNNHFDVLNRDEAQEGKEEEEYKVDNGNSNSSNVNYDSTLYNNVTNAEVNCSSLGLLRKDLQGVFKVFKIVAPILVIVLSIYDFIKAITGKVDGEMKKVFMKFLKRLAFACVLFFLPNILDFFLGLVDPGYSTCINN